MAITSTVMKTIVYPFPTLNLSKQQCNEIMAPILHFGLPALGVCRNFPRKMVLALTEFLGLGLKHIYMVRQVFRLKDIMHHTFSKSMTGKLYRNSLEIYFIEAGIGTSLLSLPVQFTEWITTNFTY